jgi:hypothetical protein
MAKAPKGKKDRKKAQPPPSQGKPRSSLNLKAIKVLMMEEIQREPVMGNMARAPKDPKGKKDRKKDSIKKRTMGYKYFCVNVVLTF